MLLGTPLLLALVLLLPSADLLATSNEDRPPVSFGVEIDRLKVEAEALENEAREEADAEHYEEAVQLLRSVKSLLAERENLFKEKGRKASSEEELSSLARGLQENMAWRKRVKELTNVLKLAL